jgi:hypothetical protein
VQLPGGGRQNFKLVANADAEQTYRQLPGNVALDSLPHDTEHDRRMQQLVRNNCTSCHTASYPLQFRFDEAGWNAIIELMKNVAHVSGKDWLGSMPEAGPAFYLGAEDDEEEIHIRLAAIAKHYNTTFEDLTADGLRVLPLLGKDATLLAVTKGGAMEVTSLYRQIYEAAGDIKPKPTTKRGEV